MKKNNRRARTKFRALQRDLNTKVRRYYIEPDYLNGVISEDGEVLIRPLTEEEKEWLNKYYEEAVVTGFKKDGSDFYYDDPKERKKCYDENNIRNRDIYNKKQVTGQLMFLNDSDYEQYCQQNLDCIDHELLLILGIEPWEEIE